MEEFDDIDDYIDPVYVEEDIAEEDSVSKFCLAVFNPSEKKPIGTGILISSTGIFISVAHNFENENITIKAFFDGKIYEICSKYNEYKYVENDLFIGTLSGFSKDQYNNEEFPKLVSSSNLNIGSKVSITGFKSEKVNKAELLNEITIIDGLIVLKQRAEKTIIEPDRSQKTTLKGLEDRCMAFMDRNGSKKYSGFSGGPVYQGNEVYGIISSHLLIRSDYINSVLKSINISNDNNED